LTKNLPSLDQYVLRRKTITYIKDERLNLNTMTIALKFIVKCEILVWMKAFKELVLAMVLSKIC
jgi:hypothetical protein